MKANSTIKHILLAFTIVLGMTACKKDKKDPDPVPPAEVKMISLADLKALSTGASVKVPDAKKITGIIISDVSNKNIDSKTVVLQDAATQTGIIISFDAAQTFTSGDQLEVNVSNQTLAQVNGEVVLQNVPAANAKKTGTGTITAKATTATEIATNKAVWDGTLVTIAATGLTGGNGKYAGTLTIADASGTVVSNVLAGASFENATYPISVSAITGVVRVNGTDVSVNIRNTSDVTSSATRFVTEDFKTSVDNFPFFSSPFAEWSDGNFQAHQLLTPLAQDGFLQAGRSYLYLKTVNNNGQYTIQTTAEKDLTGLKTISVTFAGSKYEGPGDIFGGAPFWITYPFDASKDKIGASIALVINGSAFPIAEAVYNETGKFYTLNTKVPGSIDELAARFKALADAGSSFWNRDTFNTPERMKNIATDILTSEKFQIAILNNSTIRTDSQSPYYAPIVIDNIVFGFDK